MLPPSPFRVLRRAASQKQCLRPPENFTKNAGVVACTWETEAGGLPQSCGKPRLQCEICFKTFERKEISEAGREGKGRDGCVRSLGCLNGQCQHWLLVQEGRRERAGGGAIDSPEKAIPPF